MRLPQAAMSQGAIRAFARCAVVAALMALQGAAAEPDLGKMDLEELMSLRVTSVSKREQKLSRTAAAVFVIDREDIRRSGATNIPDLLRMAPGVDVQQIDANAWAISIRGFNSRYSNKVLVLIDGRTVYTPSFSGVFWDQIDMPLENIDRIEVIRGPGATIWGANAVNGVISIFTRRSSDTSGPMVSAAAGSQLHGFGTLQYGGTAGQRGAYRVFGNSFAVGDSAMGDGTRASDHWRREHAGFRTDWTFSDRDSLMVQADLFANQGMQTRRVSLVPAPFDPMFQDEVDSAGGSFVARWDHGFTGGSGTSLRSYYDTYRRNDLGVPEVLKTFDIDVQHHVEVRDRHEIVWGLGYRVSNSTLAPGYSIALTPASKMDSLFSAFVQDEIRATDSVWVTVGCRVEHNAYTGVESEPSVRLLWNPPGSRHTVWGTAARAIRQPARVDAAITTDLQSTLVGPGVLQVVRLNGNRDIKSEEVRDYEIGYRSELTKRVSIDVAAFLSGYRNLETVDPAGMTIVPGVPTKAIVLMQFENRGMATDYGGELSLNWDARPRWRIRTGYSYLRAVLSRSPDSTGFASYALENGFPQNVAQIRSLVNLPKHIEFDQSLYYTARLPGSTIPGHARMDLRLARRIGEAGEIAVVGQNLLRRRTTEYGDAFGVVGTQAVRSIYGKITWRF